MATAVLRPRNCPSPIALPPADKTSRFVRRSKPNQSPVPNSRRSLSNEKRTEVKKEAKELVIGKVRILKRGDKIDDVDRSGSVEVELCSTDQFGMEEINKVKEVAEVKFAGCVVELSPSPSSLPMPNNCWMKKKKKYDPVSMVMDLRKMLRLDIV